MKKRSNLVYVRRPQPKKHWYNSTEYKYERVTLLGTQNLYGDYGLRTFYLVEDKKGEKFEVSEGKIWFK